MKLRNNKRTNFNIDFDSKYNMKLHKNDNIFKLMDILDYIKKREKTKYHLNDIYIFFHYFNENKYAKEIILQNKLLYITFKKKY